MIDLWLVGIGTGNPAHVTQEGQAALRDAALILVPDKGANKDDLAALREAIVADSGSKARVVRFEMPVRDETLPYQERVARWHDEIAMRWTAAIGDGGDGPVALLVWGDPGLYDSTLRIAERLEPKPNLRVVPGITALQALTAAHAIPFNTINGTVVVTTGRNVRDYGWPDGAESVFVVLDGKCSFETLDPKGIEIWWGGFLGMPEQVLVSGALADVKDTIIATRAEAREAHGWIMDTYLMRRSKAL